MTYNRRQFVKAISAAGVVGVAGCVGGDNGVPGGDDWNFGITREGTIGYVKASGWASVFENADTDISLNLNTTGGSEEAYRLCARGENEITRGTTAMGVASYEESSRPGANFGGDNAVEAVPQQTMAVTDLRTFVVTLEDDIETISDLEGRTVHGGAAGSYFMGAIPFDVIGIYDEVDIESGDWSDVPFALEEGRVDAAIVYTMGVGTSLPGWAEQLSDWDDLTMVEYTDDQLEQLEEDQFIEVADVEVSEVFNFEPNVDTVAAATHPYQWYVHPDLEEDSVYEFMDITFDNVETLQGHHDALEIFDQDYAVDSLAQGAPVHPGAADWFRDNDIWNDDLIEG